MNGSPKVDADADADAMDRLAHRRAAVERNAMALFVGATVTFAIVAGSIIISGWFAGAMEDHAERFFWTGSMVGGLMVLVFAAAAFPGGRNDARAISRVGWLTRIGLVLFILSPTLIIGSLVCDYYL